MLTSDVLDTRGYDYATFIVIGTTSNTATNNPSTLSVTEGDTTSSMAAIATLTGDNTTSGFTIPNSPTATTTAPFAVINVNCIRRKRYLTVNIVPTTTQTFTVLALLSRAEQAPVSATDVNAAVVVNA